MLYEDYETAISRGNLAAVLGVAGERVCLLGGWAVYLVVNPKYKQAHGKNYHGSKDIDLGFHFSRNESPESIRRSALARSIGELERIGFYETGSRMVMQYHRESRRRLSEEESKKIPLHNLFSMYVDPIVDNVPEGISDVLGFVPLDEKMLKTVFEDGMYDRIDEFDAKIMLPKPDILLSTKIAALPNRTKDHKRHKDVADIYALVWYSGMDPAKMKAGVLRHMPQADIEKALLEISDTEYENAANAIEVAADDMRDAIRSFIGHAAHAFVDTDPDSKWHMPNSLKYGTFIKIPRILHQQGASSEPISPAKLASLTSIGRQSIMNNLAFLVSVGIVKKINPQSYVLTPLGTVYAKAHAAGSDELLKSASLDMIAKSHLKSLADMLDVNNPKLDEVYAWIKTAGRYPDGDGVGGMHPPTGLGAKTLLHIFADAGLVPAEMIGESGSMRHKPGAAGGKQKGHGAAPGTDETSPPVRDQTSLGRLSITGIGNVDINDLDTLGIAETFMRILRKKLEDAPDG